MSSNCAAFWAPPLLETLAGLPPASWATSGERLRASRGTLAAVPLTCTVSTRCSPGASGEESASRVRARKLMENGGGERLAQKTSMTAGPGSRSVGGSAIAGRGGNPERGRADFGGREGRGVNTGRPRGYGCVDYAGIQRGDEQGAPGGVGDQVVAVREIHGDARGEAPVPVQHRKSGRFAGHDAFWKEQSARGRGGRGLLWQERRRKRQRHCVQHQE